MIQGKRFVPLLRWCVMVLGCIMLCAAPLCAQTPKEKTAAPPAASHKLSITPRADKRWGGPIEDVHKVLYSAAHELWTFFPERSLAPIIVEPKGGPIVLDRRGPNGEYYVRLDTGDLAWAQHAYQFAHEFGHILCNYDEHRHRNKWFEESLCELASLFALRRMAKTWETQPPYPNWKPYAPHLAEYAQQRMKDAQLPAGTTLGAWFRQNAEELYANATLRDKNTIVATALLPLFEEQPEHWAAVAYLNTGKARKPQSFAEFLQEWRSSATEKHRAFIESIGRKFEIEIK